MYDYKIQTYLCGLKHGSRFSNPMQHTMARVLQSTGEYDLDAFLQDQDHGKAGKQSSGTHEFL
jgi:hypothetical protein